MTIRNLPWLIAWVLSLFFFNASVEAKDQAFDGGPLGALPVFTPPGIASHLVLMFSDRDGWTADLKAAAQTISANGAIVVGIDLPRFLGTFGIEKRTCLTVVGELEQLSHRLQRQLGMDQYRSPILAGVGEGATLAYAVLAQAPAATFEGAVSLRPASSLSSRLPLCPGAPVTRLASDTFAYGATTDLNGWWRVATDDSSMIKIVDQISDHGLVTRVPDPRESSAAKSLASLLIQALMAAPADETTPEELPITEIPAAQPGPMFAIVYSGDGGWRDIDKSIGETLAQSGIPVVGVDSLRYFWQPKTPEEAGRDLASIIRHYKSRWNSQHVILVGYSFGGGILPFAVNRLPPDVRESVVQLSLLGVEPKADFEIRVLGWLGMSPGADALALQPEVSKLDPHLLQCFYGEEEGNTDCTHPEFANAEVFRMPGGHHFNGNYRALAAAILQGAHRRLKNS